MRVDARGLFQRRRTGLRRTGGPATAVVEERVGERSIPLAGETR